MGKSKGKLHKHLQIGDKIMVGRSKYVFTQILDINLQPKLVFTFVGVKRKKNK